MFGKVSTGQFLVRSVKSGLFLCLFFNRSGVSFWRSGQLRSIFRDQKG